MSDWDKDLIATHTEIHFDLGDRLRLLVSGVLYVMTRTKVDAIITRTGSAETSIIIKPIRNPPVSRGWEEVR